MKYTINLETLGLSEVVKKGRTVREDLLKELEVARTKVSDVNWREELETFRENPVEVAQNYLNRIDDVVRNKILSSKPVEGTVKQPTTAPKAATASKKPVAAKKTATTRRKSTRKPRAKTATKQVAVGEKKITTKRAATKKTTTRSRKVSPKKAQ